MAALRRLHWRLTTSASGPRRDEVLRAGRCRGDLDFGEAGVFEHPLELGGGKGLTGWGRAEHLEREEGREVRRDAVRIRHEFHRDCLAALAQRRTNLLQERRVGGFVEVMKEIGEKNEI